MTSTVDVLTHCPSCDSVSHWEVAREGEFALRRCGQCAMLFVSPRPQEEQLNEIYSGEYFQGESKFGNPEGYRDSAAGYVARAKLMVQWLRDQTGICSGRWLDIGCGPGYLVEVAVALGFEATGVDVSVEAVELGRARGLHLIQAREEAISSVVEPGFQVISMMDTLFHLRSPHVVISQAFQLLRPGGILLAGPFDLHPEPFRPSPCSENHDLQRLGVPEHLSFVNQTSMDLLLRRVGFSEIRFQPMARPPAEVVQRRFRFVPGWLIRLLRRVLAWLPNLRLWIHKIAARDVNPSAGYVLACREAGDAVQSHC